MKTLVDTNVIVDIIRRDATRPSGSEARGALRSRSGSAGFRGIKAPLSRREWPMPSGDRVACHDRLRARQPTKEPASKAMALRETAREAMRGLRGRFLHPFSMRAEDLFRERNLRVRETGDRPDLAVPSARGYMVRQPAERRATAEMARHAALTCANEPNHCLGDDPPVEMIKHGAPRPEAKRADRYRARMPTSPTIDRDSARVEGRVLEPHEASRTARHRACSLLEAARPSNTPAHRGPMRRDAGADRRSSRPSTKGNTGACHPGRDHWS
jgi:hypothetical protein